MLDKIRITNNISSGGVNLDELIEYSLILKKGGFPGQKGPVFLGRLNMEKRNRGDIIVLTEADHLVPVVDNLEGYNFFRVAEVIGGNKISKIPNILVIDRVDMVTQDQLVECLSLCKSSTRGR